MDSKERQQAKREARMAQANRDELVECIARAIREDGKIEPMKGLYLNRCSSTMESIHTVTEPSFCVIAQGSKEVFLGKERYLYDPYHYLLVTAELPLVGHVLEASKERPYLSLRLKLDPTLVASVMVEVGDGVFSHASHPSSQNSEKASLATHAEVRAINVSSLDAGLLDAVVRFVRLLDSPTEATFLAPLIMREIVYRLLRGEQGGRLRHIAALNGYTPHIVKAIERLRKDFDQPLRIDRIAREVGMSVSGFHHHFKAVTAMSPLQFQKRLRLQEARRLMLGEGLDASSVAYRVGYDDVSHFTREYKKLFGLPPLRDVARLREAQRA
ncbi:MAG: AraC family transcriptional regulator [candidate division KSB1 bacterium]|nr:AraC family transcriptional regulator [candidate division KSB1 bacterium]MDZ7305164.1 AraC family transcriptional regulator [candidate division KSB1 bacterium]MDZ7312935.1 AraC family transcriptional regulator [candidate division KSB1 bacterium]